MPLAPARVPVASAISVGAVRIDGAAEISAAPTAAGSSEARAATAAAAVWPVGSAPITWTSNLAGMCPTDDCRTRCGLGTVPSTLLSAGRKVVALKFEMARKCL